MRVYNPGCRYSAQAPLRAWKPADLLAQVPKDKVKEFSMKTMPVKVLQEILLTPYGTITDLFGQTEQTYAVDLDFAAKINKYDIWDEFGEYISEKERKNEREREAREAQRKAEQKAKEAREKAKAEKKKQAKIEQVALNLGLAERFSKDDTTMYFARVEFRRSVYNEAAGVWTYTDSAYPYDAVIFRGVVYSKKYQNHRVTSKGVKIIHAEPGHIYLANYPYDDIIIANEGNIKKGFTENRQWDEFEALEERYYEMRRRTDAWDARQRYYNWEERVKQLEKQWAAEDEAKRHVKDQQAEHERYMTETYGPDWKIQLEKFLKEDEERRKLLIEKYGPDWQNYTS